MFKGEQLCPSENKNEGRRRPKINNINSSKKVTESMNSKGVHSRKEHMWPTLIGMLRILNRF